MYNHDIHHRPTASIRPRRFPRNRHIVPIISYSGVTPPSHSEEYNDIQTALGSIEADHTSSCRLRDCAVQGILTREVYPEVRSIFTSPDPSHYDMCEAGADYQRSSGRDVGPALLYYGCHSEVDALYDEELKRWEAEGVVSFRHAFSRDSEKSNGCKYVQ